MWYCIHEETAIPVKVAKGVLHLSERGLYQISLCFYLRKLLKEAPKGTSFKSLPVVVDCALAVCS